MFKDSFNKIEKKIIWVWNKLLLYPVLDIVAEALQYIELMIKSLEVGS